MAKDYSLLAAVTAMSEHKAVVGFEKEMSDEMAKRCKRAPGHGGIFLPDGDLCREAGIDLRAAGSETLGTPHTGTISGIGGDGRYTVGTDLRLDLFVHALTAKTVLGRAGVQLLTGLTGNVAVPKSNAIDAAWITAEGDSAAKKNPTFGQVVATPHTVAAYTQITRALMVQTGRAVQQLVVDMLASAIARAVETAVFSGSGSSGEPTGLTGLLGSGQYVYFTANAPTKAKVVELITKVDEANAEPGTMKFIARPSVWGLLGSTIDAQAVTTGEGSSTVSGVVGGKYLLDTTTNTMEGYEFLKSNLIPAKQLFFGDWSQLMIATWRGTELMVDNYSQSTSGATRVVAFNDMDVIPRHAEAFAVGATVLS